MSEPQRSPSRSMIVPVSYGASNTTRGSFGARRGATFQRPVPTDCPNKSFRKRNGEHARFPLLVRQHCAKVCHQKVRERYRGIVTASSRFRGIAAGIGGYLDRPPTD